MPKGIDAEAVRELADLLDETGLTEIEYDSGGIRIRVARGGEAAVALPAAATAPAPAIAAPAAPALAESAASDADANHPGAVISPMVGTIYLAPEPGTPNFVGPGDEVTEGQTLMLVEAMKTFNEIKAPSSGTVARIVVENSQPVEYGDVLLVIE